MTWRDRIAADRMAVDREFTDRVRASEFSGSEWSMVMTAVEFDVEHPDDEERARLVAETDRIEQVLPEMERVRDQMPGAGAAGRPDRRAGSGGLFDSIKRAVGLDSGDATPDADRLAAAEDLADEYATRLQRRLEDEGRWAEIRALAAREGASPADVEEPDDSEGAEDTRGAGKDHDA